MNSEEADQDVADEVSESVNARGDVMCSGKKRSVFLTRSGLVGEQE